MVVKNKTVIFRFSAVDEGAAAKISTSTREIQIYRPSYNYDRAEWKERK